MLWLELELLLLDLAVECKRARGELQYWILRFHPCTNWWNWVCQLRLHMQIVRSDLMKFDKFFYAVTKEELLTHVEAVNKPEHANVSRLLVKFFVFLVNYDIMEGLGLTWHITVFSNCIIDTLC